MPLRRPGIINIDGTGKIVGISSAAEKLFSYSYIDALGLSIKVLIADPVVYDHQSAKTMTWDAALSMSNGEISAYLTEGYCRDGAVVNLKMTILPWQRGKEHFRTLLVDTLDAAEGYTASLLEEIEFVQEVAIWAGLPAVIGRATGWFERAHPGSRMWLRVQDAEGEYHCATSPQLPEELARLLQAQSEAQIKRLAQVVAGTLTDFSTDTLWPAAIRRAALRRGLYFGGIQLIGIQPDQPLGVLAIFCPEDPNEVQRFHALEKAAELVVLAAELNRTERRAREARAAFSALLNAAVDAIVVIDEKGNIVSFNAAAEKIFGYQTQEVIGRNVKIFMPEPYRRHHDSYIANYLSSRIPRVIGVGRETLAQRKDGMLFPVELAIGEVRVEETSRFVGIVRDISERKRTELLLRQQQEQLRATLECAPTGITSLDADGRFLNANRVFCEMLGYTESTLQVMNVRQVIHQEDIMVCLDYLYQAFHRNEDPVDPLRTRYVRQDGQTIHGVLHSSMIRDPYGRPLRLVAQVEDITRNLQLEEETRQSRERLTYLTRLSTMGEMAAGIAHEINQPLTAIASYAQACRRRLESDRSDTDRVLELLAKVDEQALRAGEVIRRLRSMMKKRESRQEIVHLDSLINESVLLARVDSRLLNCRLEVTLDEDLPDVIGDPVQIQQVLLNLIRNGVDAMDSKSCGERRLRIATQPYSSEYAEIAVIDWGVGLDQVVAEQLFTPFVTTKAAGLGMGLAISRSIIAAHGGCLWYSKNPSGGAIFHFTLPFSGPQ